jgi:hypothetical protein
MSEQLTLLTSPRPTIPNAMFDGDTFEPKHDHARLRGQLLVVFNLMADQEWRTLGEISALTGYPEQSVSARLRDLRKRKFNAHKVERRPRGRREDGLYEYQLLVRT